MVVIDEALLTELYSSQLLLEYSTQSNVGVSKQCFKTFVKFVHHARESVHVHQHHFNLCQGLAIELAFNNIFEIKRLRKILGIIDCKRYDINLSEIVALADLNIDNILLLFRFLQNIASCSSDQKINSLNIFIVDVNILVLGKQLRLQFWTDPSQELLRFVLQEGHNRVGRSMNQQNALVLQFGWQSLYEIVELVQIIVG